MANLVQKLIVHKAEEASSLLPQHIALVDEEGGDWDGGAASVDKATTQKEGTVKKASAVTAVSAEDAVAAASDAPTKAEYDKLVELANANKAAINDIISKMKTAGQMA